MSDETLFQRGTTLVRRLRLAPGEAMPWHRDPFHRVTVTLAGDALEIEYRDGGDARPGSRSRPDRWTGDLELLDRQASTAASTSATGPTRRCTVCFLDAPGSIAQPSEG